VLQTASNVRSNKMAASSVGRQWNSTVGINNGQWVTRRHEVSGRRVNVHCRQRFCFYRYLDLLPGRHGWALKRLHSNAIRHAAALRYSSIRSYRYTVTMSPLPYTGYRTREKVCSVSMLVSIKKCTTECRHVTSFRVRYPGFGSSRLHSSLL
jgi:hypothetical protein